MELALTGESHCCSGLVILYEGAGLFSVLINLSLSSDLFCLLVQSLATILSRAVLVKCASLCKRNPCAWTSEESSAGVGGVGVGWCWCRRELGVSMLYKQNFSPSCLQCQLQRYLGPSTLKSFRTSAGSICLFQSVSLLQAFQFTLVQKLITICF